MKATDFDEVEREAWSLKQRTERIERLSELQVIFPLSLCPPEISPLPPSLGWKEGAVNAGGGCQAGKGCVKRRRPPIRGYLNAMDHCDGKLMSEWDHIAFFSTPGSYRLERLLTEPSVTRPSVRRGISEERGVESRRRLSESSALLYRANSPKSYVLSPNKIWALGHWQVSQKLRIYSIFELRGIIKRRNLHSLAAAGSVARRSLFAACGKGSEGVYSYPVVGFWHESDDDPHLGQVTPHHLISPAPALQFRTLGRGCGVLSTTTTPNLKRVFGGCLGKMRCLGVMIRSGPLKFWIGGGFADEAGVVAAFEEDRSLTFAYGFSSLDFSLFGRIFRISLY